ncbi:ATP-binding cassette domain-containing protein, partial [Thioalkalicoccus limnaeus]
VVLVVLAVFGLSEAVGLLPGAYQRVGQMRRAAQRLREVAETRPALPEPAVASAPGATPDLHFEQVRLRYRADGPLVLDGIDLAIPPGETVLITGRSGAGKTSLAAVALRLVAPETGEARVGGVPVAQLRYHDLYAQFGALTQETTLFADSLAENLRLVDPDATDAALRAALFTAGLDDFVATLADGLDTRVGEGGAKLSGGQARRLALTRVILRDPPLVILDEPFRGLDHDTIARLRERLAPWLATRAALIIAHDTSTAPPATRHYRLRAGRLVEAAPSRDGPPPTAARSIATGSPPPTG